MEDQVNVAANSEAQSTDNITEATPEETHETESASTESKSTAFNAKDLHNMSTDEQFEALKAAGVLSNTNTDTKKAEPEAESEEANDQADDTQSTEPSYEIKVGGKVKKVSQKDLIALAQQGDDYTQKMQALADERRQLEALKAAYQVQAETNPKKPVDKTKASQDTVKAEYDAAVAQASQQLGIDPDDFNQFDPTHAFALQKVVLQKQEAQKAQYALDNQVAAFVQAAQKDPMTQDIDANFDKALYQVGLSDPQKANAIMVAKQRFFNRNYTQDDLNLLKSHWEYTKTALTAAKNANTNTANKKAVEPPVTESAGSSASTPHKRFNAKNLRSMDNDDKFAALKAAGII